MDASLAKENVLRKIHNAFQGVTLGHGVGLSEGQAIDNYADDATRKKQRKKDEQNDWRKIPINRLNKCHSSLSFFDAEGMRFHLPAFLVAQLQGDLNVDPIFHLTQLNDFSKGKLALLSTEQRKAIRAFLLFIQNDPNFNLNRHLKRALADYWNDI